MTVAFAAVVALLAWASPQLAAFVAAVGASALVARRRWAMHVPHGPEATGPSSSSTDGFADYRAVVQHLEWSRTPEGVLRFLRPQLVDALTSLDARLAQNPDARTEFFGEAARLLDPSTRPTDLPQEPDQLDELVLSLIERLERL